VDDSTENQKQEREAEHRECDGHRLVPLH